MKLRDIDVSGCAFDVDGGPASRRGDVLPLHALVCVAREPWLQSSPVESVAWWVRIVVLGSDGTNRVVAAASADVPLVSISTGTNNAFPRPVEPTVAGLAAGLVAINPHSRQAGNYRAKKLIVHCGDRIEEACEARVVLLSRPGSRLGAGRWPFVLGSCRLRGRRLFRPRILR